MFGATWGQPCVGGNPEWGQPGGNLEWGQPGGNPESGATWGQPRVRATCGQPLVGATCGHPVSGVSTEGGAGARSQLWVGSVILNKILGVVPKREFSLIKITKM